jgi:hypothetical protein
VTHCTQGRPPADCSSTCRTKPAAGMSRVDPARDQHNHPAGSTRLRVEGSSKLHVRELKNPAVTAEDFRAPRNRDACPVDADCAVARWNWSQKTILWPRSARPVQEGPGDCRAGHSQAKQQPGPAPALTQGV